MKNLKNQKGITLVALVVTIIVLLILAGVSLSLVAGSDGILGKATNAVDKHQIATIKEKIELKIAEEVENFYEAKYVDRSIDNAYNAYDYLKGADIDADTSISDKEAAKAKRKTISEAGADYEIVYNGSNFFVRYSKGKTLLSGNVGTDAANPQDKETTSGGKVYNVDKALSGTISDAGSLTWN